MNKTSLFVIAAALLVATLAALPVAAQPPTFSQAFQVRGAVGDIPLTEAIEPSGAWNMEQKLTVAFSDMSSEDDRTFRFALPAGSRVVNVTCSCGNFQSTPSANFVTVVLGANNEAGQVTMRVSTTQIFDSVVGFSIFAPLGNWPEQAIILYVPSNSALQAPVKMDGPLPATQSPANIYYTTFDANSQRPVDLWFSIQPSNAVVVKTPTGPSSAMVLGLAVLGIAVGAAGWATLVSKGLVQRKGRKQEAATASHVTAAATDSPAVLEGKKRALMAALKELELARQSNAMTVEVYDVVKADLKKQAVTVMRALEAAATEKA